MQNMCYFILFNKNDLNCTHLAIFSNQISNNRIPIKCIHLQMNPFYVYSYKENRDK